MQQTGEKRSLAATFPDDQGDDIKSKKARLEPLADAVAEAASGLQGDSMDIDADNPVVHAIEGEPSRRFKALEEREIQLNRDLSLLKNGILWSQFYIIFIFI